MNISVTPELEQFVAQLVKSGRYLSASEVVREALRLLEDHETLRALHLEEIKKKIAVGVEQAERGEVAPLDIDAIKRRGRQRLAAAKRKGA